MGPIVNRAHGAPAIAPGADLPGPLGLHMEYRGVDGRGSLNSLTVDEAARQLTRTGLAWGAFGQSTTVTFAFRQDPGTLPEDVGGFSTFTAAQIQATLLALQAWSDVANIVFQRVDNGSGYSNDATLLFGNYSQGADGAAAFAFMPGNRASTSSSGDIWVNSSLTYNADPRVFGYGQLALVHEIGHALGLSHPGDYDASADGSLIYGVDGGYAEDTLQYTVMSYFRETSSGARYGTGYPAAPMLDDIAAMQRLYGANLTTRAGDTVYGFNSNTDRPWFQVTAGGPTPIFAVWDAGGIDTFDFSGFASFTLQTIDLRQGAFSDVGGLTGNVAIAVGVVIENLITGAGDDLITGNSADNRITAGAGSNRIDGGLGFDTVVFAGPRSAYSIGWNGNQGAIFRDGESTTVHNVELLVFSDATVAATPSGGLDVSGDLTNDTILGTALNDFLLGMGGADVVRGLAGTDQLLGGTGDDIVDGGADNDIIYADEGDDTIIGGDGIDALHFETSVRGVNVNLAQGISTGIGSDRISGIENLTGSRFNDVLIGDQQANRINAFGGSDIIHGGGGDDTLTGSWVELRTPDLVKAIGLANGSIATAVSVDNAFDRKPSDDLPWSTGSNATVVATTHGGLEYYAVTVASAVTITLDIDGASFDTTLKLFDAAGNELGRNDDRSYTGDGGGRTDSFLTVRITTPGVYYVQVGQFAAVSGSSFETTAPRAGETYTLRIAVPEHAYEPNVAQGSSLYGEDGADTLDGSDGTDFLDGGSGDDRLSGRFGNDILTGGGNNDVLDGGASLDAAVYSGLRRQYTASSSQVSGNGEGTDTLISIEEARFVDGVLTFDASSASAQVMRLYSATLNRTPDQAGLESNVAGLAQIGLLGLANIFVASAEFQARFGALNNQQFVEQMYRFALGREGDAAGIANWVGVMNGGATRGQMVVAFSESLEHQARTAATLNAGLWVPDIQAQVIARMYDATFDRLPDAGGLAGWTAALKGGMALIDIAAAFAGSAEFQARYGAVSNEQFVRQMYQFCLNREPDAGGLAGWVNALNTGTSRAQMLLNFSESAEHVALTAASWLGGIRFQGYVGAPVETSLKGLDDAQVLTDVVDDGFVYDPGDLDLRVTDKDADALVLPGDPDGGVWTPSDVGALETGIRPIPFDLDGDPRAVTALLRHWAHDEAFQLHRDHLETAWA